jgi:hypothetical protein
VDLFAAAGFESSESARLLTYSMALEVLTPPEEKHDIALGFLAKWQRELVAELHAHPEQSGEYAALESLNRELFMRRQASIRGRLRSFVARTLEAAGVNDAAAIAKKTVLAYDRRSMLVHQGALDPDLVGPTIGDLRGVLELLIRARLQ